MNETVDEDDIREPAMDDAPVTMSLIRTLIDAHPHYRATSHYATNDNKFVMIEIPREPDAFTDGAPGAFVSFVSAIADDEHFIGDTDTIVSERNAAYATLLYRTESAVACFRDGADTPFMWVTGTGMNELVSVDEKHGDPEQLPHGMFGDILVSADTEIVEKTTIPAFETDT